MSDQQAVPVPQSEVPQEIPENTQDSCPVGETTVEASASASEIDDPELREALTKGNDPALVNIDKLVEGEISFLAEGDDREEMAEKHAKKNKKKSKETAMDQLQTCMKALTPEEQIETVMSKYAELADNNRQLQSTVKAIQKQVESVSREKESMEAEHSKIVLTKSRLESLCRELQRQNKLIKDENVSRLKEEEERRKEVSAKFNATLSEISNLMKENNDKNSKLRDENQDMAGRLTDLVKQYENRESHVEKILKTKDLQCQLVEAKLAKQHIDVTENKEQMLLEKKALLEDIGSYQQKLQVMSETEITLRTQLNSYMGKYEEFQTTLDKSNKIFNTFKKEMDEMTKKIKKLEKETKTWKERWEGANKALLDMVTERTELEKKMEIQGRQNTQLQNLCRALQEQCTELRKQNKSASSAPEIKTDILDEELVTEVSSVPESVSNAIEVVADADSPDNSSSSETHPKSESSKETSDTVATSEDVGVVNGIKAAVTTNGVMENDAEVVTSYLDVD